MTRMTNEEILNVLEELENQTPTFVLEKEAPLEEQMKHALCKLFVMYMHRKKVKASELKNILKIPKTRISDIVNYKTNNYTIDRLLSYAKKLSEIDPQTANISLLL